MTIDFDVLFILCYQSASLLFTFINTYDVKLYIKLAFFIYIYVKNKN